jgi:tetratricopeptide (TPR) repeat protein
MLAALFLMAAVLVDIHQRVFLVLGPEEGKQAQVMLDQKRYAEVEALVSASKAEPREMLALNGSLEFLGGRMETAARYLGEAEQLGDLQEPDRFTLAMAWVRLGRDEDARGQLNKLQRQQPGKSLYVYWLGRVDYDERRYAEAVEHLKMATRLDAQSARAWDSLGLAYDMQGDSENALKAFEEGARLNRAQAHASAWPPHDLGALLLRIGNTKQAEEALREALRMDPQMPEAHYHLGRALEKDGLNEEAVAEYVAAMAEDKTGSEACYSLALLYRKMGREKESAAMLGEWRRRRDAAR